MGQLLVYNTDATPNMIDFQIDLDNLDPHPVTGFWDTEKAMRFVSFNRTHSNELFSFRNQILIPFFRRWPQNAKSTYLMLNTMVRITIQVTYFTCRKLMKDSVAFSITWDHLTRSSKLTDLSSRNNPQLRFVYSNDTYNTDNRTFWVKLGTSNGLELLVVNNVSDYYYPTMNVIGFQILTFNPFEYPEAITGNYRRDILEMGETSYFEVQTSVHRANRDITRYSKRKVRLNFSIFFCSIGHFFSTAYTKARMHVSWRGL